MDKGTPLNVTQPANRQQELKTYILALEQGDAGVHILKKIALLSSEHPSTDPASPSNSSGLPGSPSPFFSSHSSIPSLHTEIWDMDRNFDRLFKALQTYCIATKVKLLTPRSYLSDKTISPKKSLNMHSLYFGKFWKTRGPISKDAKQRFLKCCLQFAIAVMPT